MAERDGLIYEPAPQPKSAYDALNKQLAEITGLSPKGEGWMRCEWGMDATRYYGGRELPLVYDPKGKYWGINYNVLLVWVPSEVYDRLEWAQLRFEGGTDVLGPFPHAGSWDLHRVCYRAELDSNDDFEYMPLGEEILQIARQWREVNNQSGAKQRAVAQYKEFQKQTEERREAAFQKERQNIQEDLRKEFEKPDLTLSSFSQTVREAGLNDVPSGYTRISTNGIIVPSHVAAAQE